MVCDGVQADAWFDADGGVSLARLWPLPKLGPTAPRIELRRVRVRWLEPGSNRRPVSAELEQVVVDNSAADAPGKVGDTSVSTRASTDFADQIALQLDRSAAATDLRCAVQGISLNRDLIDRLPLERWPGSLGTSAASGE